MGTVFLSIHKFEIILAHNNLSYKKKNNNENFDPFFTWKEEKERKKKGRILTTSDF